MTPRTLAIRKIKKIEWLIPFCVWKHQSHAWAVPKQNSANTPIWKSRWAEQNRWCDRRETQRLHRHKWIETKRCSFDWPTKGTETAINAWNVSRTGVKRLQTSLYTYKRSEQQNSNWKCAGSWTEGSADWWCRNWSRAYRGGQRQNVENGWNRRDPIGIFSIT